MDLGDEARGIGHGPAGDRCWLNQQAAKQDENAPKLNQKDDDHKMTGCQFLHIKKSKSVKER